MKKEKCKKHVKVYSQASVSTNNGITTNWICRECGTEGHDFSPRPDDEYERLCQEFR